MHAHTLDVNLQENYTRANSLIKSCHAFLLYIYSSTWLTIEHTGHICFEFKRDFLEGGVGAPPFSLSLYEFLSRVSPHLPFPPLMWVFSFQMDLSKIEVIKWLVFEDAQRSDAIIQGNALMRQFLGEDGRLNGCSILHCGWMGALACTVQIQHFAFQGKAQMWS